tara:strand:+ start:4935 stop:5426 length:492 start_codon:yes stop_codon:yes gene_type:complete
MSFIKATLIIFVLLGSSRFIPHPPNFTSLIALSFYLPAIFGRKFIPIILLGFILTDLFIGIHNYVFFTWGSIILIGLSSKYLKKKISFRLLGSLFGAFIFFFFSNLGYYLTGYYGYGLESLIKCYIMAIPFFGFTALSTLIFALLIELVLKIKNKINPLYIWE